MKFFFRVDASSMIGSGHLMRCLTLAGQLRKMGVEQIAFISRDLVGNMFSLVRAHGYELYVLPRHVADEGLCGYDAWLTVSQELDARETMEALQGHGMVDWLIVDSYAIDRTWESMLRPYVSHIMAIDDLANRVHDVDLLLDQNFPAGREASYTGLVPEDCRLLIGQDYLLLRDEFYDAEKKQRNGIIERVLVFFGGSDITNETGKALQALENFPDMKVDVVVGAGNPCASELEARCACHESWSFHFQIDYIAALMNKADLSIGAGGTTTWERCYLGLPSFVISIADNQSEGAEYYASRYLLHYLGKAEDVAVEDIVASILLFQDETMLYRRIQEGMKKVFEHHVPYRVADIIVHGWEEEP